MQLQHRYLFIICAFLMVACSSSEDKKEQETIDPNAQSSITGTILLAANLVADSDLNDINTESINNSSFSTAQEIENHVTVQGFATKVATSTFEKEKGALSERKSDRFYTSSDEYDFFKVNLVKDQVILLQTVNSNYYESDDDFSGDLDLALYDSNYSLIAYSEKLTAFDAVKVPETSDYFIGIHANAGASKYILRLAPSVHNTAQTAPYPDFNAALDTNSMDFLPSQLIIQFSNAASAQTLSHPAISSLKTTNPGQKRATLAYLPDTNVISASSYNQHPALKELASLNPLSYEKLMTIYRLKTLQALPQTQFASLNYIRHAFRVPSDTYYNSQWHYQSMNLPQAWDLTTGTPESGDVIVAVIDTGIFSSHPDLQNKIVQGYDFISDPFNSVDNETDFQFSDIDNNPEDPGDGNGISADSWHGTHVAGTIAAETNNNYGVAGVSWGAKVMPLRVLGTMGGNNYDIMQAVRFASGLENDSGTIPAQAADIINLSLGGLGFNPAEQALFSEIHDAGIIVVAAAGNEASSQLFYPAAYDDVISVSALDFNSSLAPYSNYGSSIDIAAPGGDMTIDNDRNGEIDGILSTLVEEASGSKTASFAYYQGTSMAAPHVAGMFALMKAVYPALDATTVDNLLANNLLTNDIGLIGKDNLYGFGSANALKSVQEAIKLSNNTPTPDIEFLMSSSPSAVSFYNTKEAVITISNEGSGSVIKTTASSSTSSTKDDWLTVTYTDSQENGLGSYTVNVDTTNLTPENYIEEIRFTFEAADSVTTIPDITVKAYLTVSDFSSSSRIAEFVVAIFDAETFDLVKSVNASYSDNNDGLISFKLDKLHAGNYYLYAGTDIDYDGYICQYSEACAVYPFLGSQRPISLADQSTVDINISAFLVSPFNDLIQNKAMDSQKSSYKVNIRPMKTTVNESGLLIR